MSTETLGAYALSEAVPAPMPSPCKLAPHSKVRLLINGRKLWITNAKEAGSSSS